MAIIQNISINELESEVIPLLKYFDKLDGKTVRVESVSGKNDILNIRIKIQQMGEPVDLSKLSEEDVHKYSTYSNLEAQNKIADFKSIAIPIIEWLTKNYDFNTTIVIRTNGATIIRDEIDIVYTKHID